MVNPERIVASLVAGVLLSAAGSCAGRQIGKQVAAGAIDELNAPAADPSGATALVAGGADAVAPVSSGADATPGLPSAAGAAPGRAQGARAGAIPGTELNRMAEGAARAATHGAIVQARDEVWRSVRADLAEDGELSQAIAAAAGSAVKGALDSATREARAGLEELCPGAASFRECIHNEARALSQATSASFARRIRWGFWILIAALVLVSAALVGLTLVLARRLGGQPGASTPQAAARPGRDPRSRSLAASAAARSSAARPSTVRPAEIARAATASRRRSAPGAPSACPSRPGR